MRLSSVARAARSIKTRWLRDPETAIFTLLILLHLVPIWAFPYFPSQDGPAHLNNANVLREYYYPDRTVFREYYYLNQNPDPNWLGHLILAGLMYIVPILVAEKLLLSGYIVLLPISARYALRALGPNGASVAFLAFPFTYNYLFHMGFYNFSYSLPAFFFLVGYWLRHREGFTWRQVVGLALLSLVLFFSHLVSVVTAYLLIVLMALWLTACDVATPSGQRPSRFRGLLRGVWMRLVVPALAFAPTIALTWWFLQRKGMERSATPPFENLLGRLARLESLISYNEWEGWFSTQVVGLFLVVMVYVLVSKVRRREWRRWDGLLLVVAAFVYVYFTAPDGMSGGGFISHRMNLYPFLGLMLWFAVQSYEPLAMRAVQAFASAIAVALLVMHTLKYAELNDYLREYLSGSHLIETNTTVLPLCFSHQGHAPDGRVLSSRIGLFLHAPGHIGAQRRVVELDNYEGNTGYFPVQFRPAVNPFAHIGAIEAQPPQVEFLTYPARTGGRVDYVLVWRVRDDQREHEHTKSIFRQLDEGYDRIFTSPQRGFMKLYRRKGWEAARPPAAGAQDGRPR
jgi:hypothetical protein